MWSSFKGVSHDMCAKRFAEAISGVLSSLEMHDLMVMGLWGGVTESTRIRPRAGSSGSNAAFDGFS